MNITFHKMTRRFPVLFTVVFSLILAWELWFNPLFPFGYAEAEYLNGIFAQNFFSIGPFSLTHLSQPTIQNANPLTVIAVFVAHWISLDSVWGLWLGQTLLCWILIWRISVLLGYWIEQHLHYIFFLVLFINPLFWRTLLYLPSFTWVTWLFVELLIYVLRFDERKSIGYISILGLSFSGCEAFVGVFLFVIIWLGIRRFCQNPSKAKNKRQKREYDEVFIGIAALFPAVLVFLTLTLQSGVFGGARLLDQPSLFSEFSIVKLLGGEWSRHIRSLLIWFGNGCLTLPLSIPIYGLFALIGALTWIQPKNGAIEMKVIIPIFLGMFLPCMAFLPVEMAQERFLLFFVLGTIAFVQGIEWISLQFSRQKNYVAGSLLGLIVFLSIYSFPSSLQNPTARARYHSNVWNTIESILTKENLLSSELVAVRFTPSIWYRLSNDYFGYPIGTGVRQIVEKPFRLIQLNSLLPIEYRPEINGGIRFDIGKALLFSPSMILTYPSFDEARKSILEKTSDTTESSWLEILQEHYRRERVQNLSIYRRYQSIAKEDISLAALSEMVREGRIEEIETVQSWWRQSTRIIQKREPSVEELIEEELLSRSGLSWSFEQEYLYSRRVGIAFGFSPDEKGRIGAGAAGPGSDEMKSEIGEIHSEPFVVEGEELSFFADLPKNSTASIFCLAVHTKEPLGENHKVKYVRHIFDYRAPKSLLADTFFYVRPSQLVYGEDESVIGWRVVRVLQGGQKNGWQFVSWSLDPWINQLALWVAADRDIGDFVRIDHLFQRKRPPGFYWNFEDGTYEGWIPEGTAFGSSAAAGSYGKQRPVRGFEGNYFVNSYFQGSDKPTGTLTSHSFTITMDRLEFLIGGGDDMDTLHVQLLVDNEAVLRATGRRSEMLRKVVWDISKWEGEQAKLQLVDRSAEPWGHLLVDDIRFYPTVPYRLHIKEKTVQQ